MEMTPLQWWRACWWGVITIPKRKYAPKPDQSNRLLEWNLVNGITIYLNAADDTNTAAVSKCCQMKWRVMGVNYNRVCGWTARPWLGDLSSIPNAVQDISWRTFGHTCYTDDKWSVIHCFFEHTSLSWYYHESRNSFESSLSFFFKASEYTVVVHKMNNVH